MVDDQKEVQALDSAAPASPAAPEMQSNLTRQVPEQPLATTTGDAEIPSAFLPEDFHWKTEARRLSQDRLDAILTTLNEGGQAKVAEELAEHINSLKEELSMTWQYYEEYIIPGMEGRSVGAWSDRVVVVPGARNR